MATSSILGSTLLGMCTGALPTDGNHAASDSEPQSMGQIKFADRDGGPDDVNDSNDDHDADDLDDDDDEVVVEEHEYGGVRVCTIHVTFTVTHAMAPLSRLLVYYVRENGEGVADSFTFNVQPAYKNRVSVQKGSIHSSFEASTL